MSKLKQLRTDRKISQKELGDILGVSQQTVGSWERGYRTPTPRDMQKLEDLFEVDKEIIFFEAFSYSK